MKKTLQILIAIIILALSIDASSQCVITPLIVSVDSTTICAGDSIQLNTDSAYASYLWSTGETTQNIYVSIVGGYTVYVTDSVGCTGTSGATVVTLNTNPPPIPGIIMGNVTPCQGSVQTYTISLVSTATGYFWSIPAGWSGSSTTTSLTVTVGSTSGNILVLAMNGCGYSDSAMIIQINAETSPSQPGVPGPDTVCAGSVFTIQDTVLNNIGGSYTWTLPNGWIGTSTDYSITVTVGSTGGIITVIANNQCGSSYPDSVLVVVDTGSVLPAPGPLTMSNMTGTTAMVSWLPDTGAFGYYIEISQDSLNWTTFMLVPNIHYTFTGLSLNTHYDVCLSAFNHCHDPSGWSCTSFTTPAPDSCFTQFNLFPDTALLHHYFITDTIGGIPPYQYLWSWGDSTYDNIPNPSHTYADSGIYTICLTITDSTGCTSNYCDSNYHIMRTANYMIYVDVISNTQTGIKTIMDKNEISVFPNPATNWLTIRQSSPSTNQELLITDVLGNEVYYQPINNSTQTIIDISLLNNGVYFYELRSGSGLQIPTSIRGKFVKE